MEEMKSNDVYLDSDGTLGISADVDISKVKRILLTQEGTHYGSMYYLDDSDHSADTNKALGNNSETPNSCSFKPGDKFILEIGQRQLDEFEIAGTDYYIKIYLLKMLTPYKSEVRTQMSSADCVSRQAVSVLDKFTKIYCRDDSVKDDLVFRCNDCCFQMQDETCLVKRFARKHCPDYKNFGPMGDL